MKNYRYFLISAALLNSVFFLGQTSFASSLERTKKNEAASLQVVALSLQVVVLKLQVDALSMQLEEVRKLLINQEVADVPVVSSNSPVPTAMPEEWRMKNFNDDAGLGLEKEILAAFDTGIPIGLNNFPINAIMAYDHGLEEIKWSLEVVDAEKKILSVQVGKEKAMLLTYQPETGVTSNDEVQFIQKIVSLKERRFYVIKLMVGDELSYISELI